MIKPRRQSPTYADKNDGIFQQIIIKNPEEITCKQSIPAFLSVFGIIHYNGKGLHAQQKNV